MNKKLYGVVEGFFSSPLKMWSFRDRLIFLRFMKDKCPALNTYFYCPKDDAFVTNKWNELYPNSVLEEIKKTVSLCKENNIEFIYGLNPSFNLSEIRRDFYKYIRQITKKLDQLKKIGVSSFSILYDDVPYAYDVISGVLSKEDFLIGKIQAKTLNRIQNFIGEGNKLLFCPSDYFLKKETPYLKAINKTLNKSVYILWTGEKIFTPRINLKMLDKAKRVIGSDRLIWWSNYPVNDCEHIKGTYHMGSFNLPSLVVQDQVKGIFMNPMREIYTNFLASYTFSLLIKNPTYSRRKVARIFFKDFFGENWQSFFRIYTSFSNRSSVDKKPSGYIKDILCADKKKKIQKILKKLGEDIDGIQKINIDTEEARLFLQNSKSLFKRANEYLEMCASIMDGRENDFKIIFPIRLGNFDYKSQIMNILEKRIAFIQTFKKSFLFNELEISKLQGIVKKYRKKNSQSINKTDKRIFFQTVRKILNKEEFLFKEATRNLSSTKRIKKITEKLFINQY